MLGDPAGKYLFDAFAGPSSSMITYTVDASTGALTQTDSRNPTPEEISTDPQGRFVLGFGSNSSGPAVVDYDVNRTTNTLSSAPGMPYSLEAPTQTVYLTPAASNNFVYALSYCSPNCGSSMQSFWNGWSIDTATGGLTPLTGFPQPAGGNLMIGAAITPSGQFLYAEEQYMNNGVANYEVVGYRVNPDGSLTRLPGTQQTLDVGVNQLLMSPNGNFVYHSASNHLRAYAINQSTGALTLTATYQIPGNGGSGWIAIDPTVKYVYIGGNSAVTGYTVNATTGALTPISGGTTSLPNEPGTVAIVAPK